MDALYGNESHARAYARASDYAAALLIKCLRGSGSNCRSSELSRFRRMASRMVGQMRNEVLKAARISAKKQSFHDVETAAGAQTLVLICVEPRGTGRPMNYGEIASGPLQLCEFSLRVSSATSKTTRLSQGSVQPSFKGTFWGTHASCPHKGSLLKESFGSPYLKVPLTWGPLQDSLRVFLDELGGSLEN